MLSEQTKLDQYDHVLKRILFIIFITSAPTFAHADWIHPYVSPQAGIDSIERILVIRDYKDSTFMGEILLTAGDVNGDSIDDLIVGRFKRTAYADDSAFLFFGGTPPDAVIDNFYSGFEINMAPIGDITGDGYLDFAMTPLPNIGLNIYFGGPSFDDVVDFAIPDVNTWITRPGDFTATGVLLLPVGDRNGGFIKIYRIDSLRDTIPEYVIPDTATSFGSRLAVLDFNGDGYDDLAASAFLNRDTTFVKFYYGGPSWDTIPDFVLTTTFPRFGDVLQPVGDYNADGYEDIYIGGPSNHPYGVHLGGPTPSSTYDILLDADISSVTYTGAYTAARVGDINNDGHSDILFGSYGAADQLFIYLGGPDADSIYDIWMENLAHIPGPQNFLGSHIAGIGDFNGDGIDDFAAFSRTQPGCCWYAEVNIFAGWNGMATDVEIINDPTLPSSFQLNQNYPNPFNPETVIEYSLPTKSHANVEIHNVLGQKITTLVDEEQSAGSYRLRWDGRDAAGEPVASGVYFYSLKVDGAVIESRKMVMVK